MNNLPSDTINIIFGSLPISDKRKFIRTCLTYNEYSKFMPDIELEFQKMIDKTKFFFNMKFGGFYNPLYKYTIELFYDNHKIPDCYIIPQNRVLHQYKKIYYIAAKRGNLDLIKKLLALKTTTCYNKKNSDWVCCGAAEAGNLFILEWIRDNGYKLKLWTAHHAAKGNQLHILKWLKKREYIFDHFTIAYAAGIGNIKLIKWLLKNKCEILNTAICYAVKNNHFEVAKWLYKKFPNLTYNLCYRVGLNGNLNIVKWIINTDIIKDSSNIIDICEGACMHGHIHLLEWLKANKKFSINDRNISGVNRICNNAAQSDNLNCVRWVIENECNYDNTVCVSAGFLGNLEMLKYLIVECNCKLDIGIAAAASKKGKFEILKWYVENNGVLSERLCTLCAEGGHLELLQYLRLKGCEWNSEVISTAARNGYLKIIQWARSEGCEWDSDACESTTVYNHLDILIWLRENGAPWDKKVCESAIKYKNLDILQWSIDNGCECDNEIYNLAFKGKGKRMLAIQNYLIKKNSEGRFNKID